MIAFKEFLQYGLMCSQPSLLLVSFEYLSTGVRLSDFPILKWNFTILLCIESSSLSVLIFIC